MEGLVIIYVVLPLVLWFSYFGDTASKPKPLSTPSNQVSLTWATEPSGAMLYEGDKAMGISPKTFLYTSKQTTGYITTTAIISVWPSGAKAQLSVKVPLGKGAQMATISRPSEAPGLQQDLEWAEKLRATQAAEDNAAVTNALIQLQYNTNWMLMNTPKIQPLNKPIYTNCQAMPYGNAVNCTSY